MRTYQARLGVAYDAQLRTYAAVFGHALRSLHASRHSGEVMAKPDFMRAFGLKSRQYNAVTFSLDGMESSIVALRPGRIADLQQRIQAADKKLAKLREPKRPQPKKTSKTRSRRSVRKDRSPRPGVIPTKTILPDRMRMLRTQRGSKPGARSGTRSSSCLARRMRAAAAKAA